MLGSGCFGDGSFHYWLRPLLIALCLFGFPAGFGGAIVGRLIASFVPMWPIAGFFYWPGNTEVS